MKGQLKFVENKWVVLPDWYLKDIIKQSTYLVHPNEDVSKEKERTVEFEIVKFKGEEFAILNVSFTKPGFIERRMTQRGSENK
jgi:hypothetical protein